MATNSAGLIGFWGKRWCGFAIGMWLLSIVSGFVILVPTRQPLDFQLALLIVSAPLSVPFLLAWSFADWTSGITDHWPFLIFLLVAALAWMMGYWLVDRWERWRVTRRSKDHETLSA